MNTTISNFAYESETNTSQGGLSISTATRPWCACDAKLSTKKKAYNLFIDKLSTPTSTSKGIKSQRHSPELIMYELSLEARDFVWQFSHRIIITRDLLAKRKLTDNDSHIICWKEKETNIHIAIIYDVSKGIQGRHTNNSLKLKIYPWKKLSN